MGLASPSTSLASPLNLPCISPPPRISLPPPRTPPYWPAFGRREILERLYLSVALMDGGSGGRCPPAPPLLAGLRPAGNSRALRRFGRLISMLGGGGPGPRAPPRANSLIN